MENNFAQNLFDYVKRAAETRPGSVVYSGGDISLTAGEVYEIAGRVAHGLSGLGTGKPVAVFMERGPLAAAAMIGVLGSGNYYIPLDDELGLYRVKNMLALISPAVVITDKSAGKFTGEYGAGFNILDFEALRSFGTDPQGSPASTGSSASSGLSAPSASSTPSGSSAPSASEYAPRPPASALATDPAYIIFTSGTSGTMKGIVASHGNVISYLNAAAEFIRPDAEMVMGLQASLCVDFCLWEMWYPFVFGTRTVFLPKKYFMSPVHLLEFMNKQGVNTIHWVASAFGLVANLGALAKIVPEVTTAIFGGEVMPPQTLALWREALPHARFIQCYGPTESTGYATYFELPDDFRHDEKIPIGKPYSNARVILLSENGRAVTEAGIAGEICVSGPGVSLGYYGNEALSGAVFVQNPLNAHWREAVYRTGDVAMYDENGDLVFSTRKDFQIKHMGYRIDLLEIEAAALSVGGVDRVCCIYDKDRIILFYNGKPGRQEAGALIKELLPRYMHPSKFVKLDIFPEFPNGKINRALLIKDMG